MRTATRYKRRKKATVELTSLLDLLFVMIFVSMIQQKQVTKNTEVKKGKLTKVKVEPTPKPIVKAKTEPKKTTPKPVVTNFPISATFNFYATTQNPDLPNGVYKMQGRYDDKTGMLSLVGYTWVTRPKNYDMVPLSGKFDSQTNTFTGKVDSPWCKTFTLTREIKGTSSPVSGIWKGFYDCGQGATGLTLSVD